MTCLLPHATRHMPATPSRTPRPHPARAAPPRPSHRRSYLIAHPGASWHDVPQLPKAACAALDAGFVLSTTRLLEVQRSRDGETTKLLVQLQDGLQVESVIMEYDNTGGCMVCVCVVGVGGSGRRVC